MLTWILQISSGAGPVEVRRFVAALSNLLALELHRRGLTVFAETRYGDEDCPKTVQLQLHATEADVAYLSGTYELIARSPERSKHDRKRWFVGVQVFLADELHRAASVDARDVLFTVCRSGGPGGQHVNRTESAVRALHQPSGISVRVDAERSQHQNRRRALQLLQVALGEAFAERVSEHMRAQRKHHHQLQRGKAMRSFRLDRRGRLVEHIA